MKREKLKYIIPLKNFVMGWMKKHFNILKDPKEDCQMK